MLIDKNVFYESGRRIKKKREELGMTMEELGKRLGLNKSTIKRYEDGSTKRITIATFEKLAKILNTTPKYLMGVTEDSQAGVVSSSEAKKILKERGIDISDFEKEVNKLKVKQANIKEMDKMHRIPILGVIRAGMPITANEEVLGYTYIENSDWENYFALKIVGDSMNAARIFDGDVVICRKQDYVENGEIAVVLIENEDATIKRVYIKDNTVTLMPQSTNNNYQPITVNLKETRFSILGKVVKVEFFVA